MNEAIDGSNNQLASFSFSIAELIEKTFFSGELNLHNKSKSYSIASICNTKTIRHTFRTCLMFSPTQYAILSASFRLYFSILFKLIHRFLHTMNIIRILFLFMKIRK